MQRPSLRAAPHPFRFQSVRAACGFAHGSRANAVVLNGAVIAARGLVASSCKVTQYVLHQVTAARLQRFVEMPQPNLSWSGRAASAAASSKVIAARRST